MLMTASSRFTSQRRKPRFLFPAKIRDTPELERLRELVVATLEAWHVAHLEVERVSE
jgi:hypothetical protein